MHVLVLGGTVFVGRHLVEELRARGHEVTLFNRGTSGPSLFPDIEQIHGDRATDLERIGDRRFDAILDPSGYLPGRVGAAANFLRDRTAHYTFISSISVYDLSQTEVDESSKLLVLPADADPTVLDFKYYGELKVLCENAAREQFGKARTLIVRPGLIVGPHDPTDRFSYWPHRFTYGGKVAAPSGPEAQVQFIDVRDLARWIVNMVERKGIGEFNATSPPGAVSLGTMLNACRAAANRLDQSEAGEIVWIDEEFLLSQGVHGWSDLPVWMETGLNLPGLTNANVSRAVAEGLRFRPLAETVQDTLGWILNGRGDAPWKAGLTPDRELALVNAFLTKA